MRDNGSVREPSDVREERESVRKLESPDRSEREVWRNWARVIDMRLAIGSLFATDLTLLVFHALSLVGPEQNDSLLSACSLASQVRTAQTMQHRSSGMNRRVHIRVTSLYFEWTLVGQRSERLWGTRRV